VILSEEPLEEGVQPEEEVDSLGEGADEADDITAPDGFDGFRVYLIDPMEGISPYFSIEHGSGDFYRGCWSNAFLQSRSLVFEGDLMTMKSHSILSHDLTDRLQDAEPIDLDDSLEEDKCSPYYFPVRTMD